MTEPGQPVEPVNPAGPKPQPGPSGLRVVRYVYAAVGILLAGVGAGAVGASVGVVLT